MHISLLALAFAAVLPISSAYPVTASALNCRSGPGTSHPIVKTYKKGADVKITCQVAGPSVKGTKVWDKTSDGCYVTDYYIRTGTYDYVAKKCDSDNGGEDKGDNDKGQTDKSGNLPTLDATQSKYAKAIIAQAKKENLGRQGCLAGIATALVESEIHVYANSKVPASLKYHHDGVYHDYDSVGIFQQRVTYYPDVAADMDPAKSASQFFAIMKKKSGWKTMDVGALCQDVQRSAYPAKYPKRVPEAKKICEAGGM